MKITFISAGAGTGKTHRVTEIIGERLASGTCRPSGLVATSFTTKAAQELAERIRLWLLGAGWVELPQRLEEARIGTVDSVCQRLLSRFAFEAGISPRLEVLGENEAGVLLGEASESVLSRGEIQGIQRLGERLAQHEVKGGRPGGLAWKKTVKTLVDLSRANGFQPAQLSSMASLSCDEMLTYFGSETSDDLERLLRASIEQALKDIAGNGDTTKGTIKYCDDLRQIMQDMERGSLTWPDWIGLSKKAPTKASLAVSEHVRETAARYSQHPALRRDIRDYTQQLFAIAARTLQRFQELKEARGMLDFTDLEQRALELLKLPEVCAALRQEIDLVVVDEFQDTSPIQLAIFLKLADLAKETFWVGDVKQAIYGFRGTDPELIAIVTKSLRIADRLSVSRRSLPDLVAVTNALFCPAFATSLGLAGQEVALSAHRPLPGHAFPAVEFFELLNNEVRKKDDQPKRLEIDAVAATIAEGVRQLLAENSQRLVVDRRVGAAPEKLRGIKPRDVAVLCRNNEHAARVAGKLVEAGFSVSFSRAGLLATPEATLAMACLRRLADPSDVLATAEILALQGGGQPEEWLESRLAYLESIESQSKSSDGWGMEPPLAHPAIIALHAAHELIDLSSPSESLDLALVRGNVAATVTGWGPDLRRAEQRRSNLEALRALVMSYEETCLTTHSPATVAGFLFWCEDLSTTKADFQASDPAADSICIITYHSAKGLEWPVTVCANLDDNLDAPNKSRLWQPTVVKSSPEATLDLADPLAGRRIRLWPSPFGQQTKDVALRTRLEDSPVGLASRSAAHAEALRLLYVGFTRARDLLVPVVQNGRSQVWLESLAAAWFVPGGKNIVLPTGELIGCATRTLTPPPRFPTEQKDAGLRWFPESVVRTPRLPARLIPSKLPPRRGATVVETIEYGVRLPMQGCWDDATLGDALHSLLACEFALPNAPNRAVRAQRLLETHSLTTNLTTADALAAVDRFKSAVLARFQPAKILAEVPFVSVDTDGQQLFGFIDLLLETAAGWIIIDHKTYPGSRAQWCHEAQAYSGQLTAYAEALTKSGRRVAGMWIHFVLGGGMVKVGI